MKSMASCWVNQGEINKMNEQEYAGFWVRVGAVLIDTVIILESTEF